jgi:hypothetical protein
MPFSVERLAWPLSARCSFRARRAVLFGALALGGCASQSDGLRREFGELKHDVVSLRAENAALRERLDALEEQGKATPAPAVQGTAAAPKSDRPELKVVRLTPEESPSEGWVAVDPSDPKRARAPAPAPTDTPTTEIRSERGGTVVQRSASAAQASPRK